MTNRMTLSAAVATVSLTAAPAWAASVTGAGSLTLTVEDLATEPTSETHDLGLGGDTATLEGLDGALAAAAYTFDGQTFGLSTFLDSGESLGTAQTSLTFTFVFEHETHFVFAISPFNDAVLPSDYKAEFAGIVAESYLDIEGEDGLGGNIGSDGVFTASGLLGPGTYTLALDALEATLMGTQMSGGVVTTLTFEPTHAPLPTATLMGTMLLSCASGISAMRRPRR